MTVDDARPLELLCPACHSPYIDGPMYNQSGDRLLELWRCLICRFVWDTYWWPLNHEHKHRPIEDHVPLN